MPIERVNSGYRDISMTFQINPLNNDLIALKDSSAIARSIRNIVFTIPGERYFDPFFGSDINKSLFENLNDISASILRDQIRNSIENYEPRVSLNDVTVTPNYDENSYDVTIVYTIIGSNALAQQLQFALQSTR
jgi:phage baseplate assembly protein W